MIEIRSCAGFEELEACVQLQVETWGYDASDVVPRKAFRVAQAIGGQVLGAFDTELAVGTGAGRAESLVGFVFFWAGNLSWSNGLRRFREASGIWNGRSIRWKSRTLF